MEEKRRKGNQNGGGEKETEDPHQTIEGETEKTSPPHGLAVEMQRLSSANTIQLTIKTYH